MRRDAKPDVLSTKPTVAKLGVKPGHKVAVLGSPQGFVDNATWSGLAFKRRK